MIDNGETNGPPASPPAAGGAEAKPLARRSWSRRLLFGLLALIALFCAYILAGFYLVPRLIRSQTTQWVRVNLGKPIALGEISFNPFSFAVDVSDMAIPGPSRPMIAFGRLHLDFSIRSLFEDAYRFDEVRIDRPFVDAMIRPDGTLNLSELVPRTRSKGPSPAIRIGTFSVNGGKVRYSDLSRPLRPEKMLTPISFTLKDFQTNRTAGGAFTLNGRSERGEGFAWTGTLSMAPIASRGQFIVSDLRGETIEKFLSEDLPIRLTRGQLSLSGSYDFAYGPKGTRLEAAVPKLTLTDLAFDGEPALFRGTVTLDRMTASIGRIALASDGADHLRLAGAMPLMAVHAVRIAPVGGAPSSAIRLEDARLDDAVLDYAAHAIDLGRLTINGADLPVDREHDGRISLMKLMPDATGDGAATAPSWTVRLAALALENAALRFEDRAVTPAARFDIRPIRLAASGVSSDLAKPVDLRFEGRINGKASLRGEGVVTPAAGVADLKIALASLPLGTILAYLPRYPGLDIASGTAGATGTLHLAGADSGALRFKGDATLDDFAVNESATKVPLFGWRGFSFSGIDYQSGRVGIERGHLIAPSGRVAILPNGTFNYTSFTAPPAPPATAPAGPQGQAAAVPAPAPAVARPLPTPAAPALPVRIGRLDIEGGTMSFADYSIDPNFEARVDALQGSMMNVSNVPGTIATIDLSGQVIDRFSPATIKGTMNLLGYDQQTDMSLAFRNIELPVFNPYSGRYAGYAIAKGKLTTEFHYRIEKRALKADHHIIIDQLQWGQATESKQKVPLPIRLATSLLKDKNGVIDLSVPVTGSLDDPKFRLAPIIWKIIGNVIEKAVTAPFRLIGSLFAGAEKAQYVDFAPGSATLPPGSADALGALAKALGQRAELRLDIPAGPAIKEDAMAIANARIDALLMAKEVKKGEPADPAALKLDERHDRLKDIYKARLGKKPVFPASSPTATADAKGDQAGLKEKDRLKMQETDWMRSQLTAAFLPSAAELAQLGSARATAIRDALLANKAIDPARVFMATAMTATAIDTRSRLELKLK